MLTRQELLRESYRLMEIRKLLRGYGIRNFNLSNSAQVMVCEMSLTLRQITITPLPFPKVCHTVHLT